MGRPRTNPRRGKRTLSSSPSIVTPEDLERFLDCPRRMRFNIEAQREKVEEPSQIAAIVGRATRRVISERAVSGKPVSWMTYTRWIDRELYGAMCPNPDDLESFERAKEESMKIRQGAHRWFHKDYLPDDGEYWGGMAWQASIGPCAVESVIEACSLRAEEITILSTKVNPPSEMGFPTGADIKNAVRSHIDAYLFYRYMDLLPNKIKWVVVGQGPSGGVGVESRECILGKKDIPIFTEETELIIIHALKGIAAGIRYPNRGLRCQQCPFNTVCGW